MPDSTETPGLDAGHKKKPTLVRQAFHDIDSKRRLSITLIEELAELLGIDPLEETLHLQDYIDLDTVDQLPEMNSMDTELGMSFEYREYFISVNNEGRILFFVNFSVESALNIIIE